MSPRRRSRGGDTVPAGYRRAVEQTPEGDSSEDEGQGSDGTAGGISDLLSDQTGGVSQQVLPGSNADLDISDQFNPGFLDTEVVNRMGLVLSLSLNYDYRSGQWIADPIDATERQAIQQELATDSSTDDLRDGSVVPGEGTSLDGQGNLALSGEPSSGVYDLQQSQSLVTEGDIGLGFILLTPVDTITANIGTIDPIPEGFRIFKATNEVTIDTAPGGSGIKTFEGDFVGGDKYVIQNVTVDRDLEFPQYDSPPLPFDIPGAKVTGHYGPIHYGGSVVPWVQKLTIGSKPNVGTATTSFDNPCRVTSHRSAQYNVCSRSSDVTVDLWNREPHGPDSTLLARDIDEREDLSDIPNSYGNLQYELTLRRAPDGSSPKVERLGHQYIK